MTRFIESCREFPMRAAYRIVGIAVSALGFAGFAGCGMGFQPGWANVPGLSKHLVFATVMSVILFLMLLSAGAALFAVPCSFSQKLIKRNYFGWGAFAFLILLWVVVSGVLCVGAFSSIRSSITHEWP